ncbi:putative zinc finger protein [Orchesella cincta]|uniref:Putative zinc finger protein n=1 Tax=Orchesella cincta TaxID=48709 RepID=A0A1D2N166_ORCCI|nr:putative zinc finger protein [Orchesella cincta]
MTRHLLSEYLAQQRDLRLRKAASSTPTATQTSTETPSTSQTSTGTNEVSQPPAIRADFQPPVTSSQTEDDEVQVLSIIPKTRNPKRHSKVVVLTSKVNRLERVNGELVDLLDSYKENVQDLLKAANSSGVQTGGVVNPPNTQVEVPTAAAVTACSSSSEIPTTMIETEKLESMESEMSTLRARCDYLENVNGELFGVLAPVPAPVVPDETAVQHRGETETALNTVFQEIEVLKGDVNCLKARDITVPNQMEELLENETDHLLEPMDVDNIEAGITLDGVSNLEEQELGGATGESLNVAPNITSTTSKSQREASEDVNMSQNPEIITVEALEDALEEDELPNIDKYQAVEQKEATWDEDREFQCPEIDHLLDATHSGNQNQPEADETHNLETETEPQAAAVPPQHTLRSQNRPSTMESGEAEKAQSQVVRTSGNNPNRFNCSICDKRYANAWNLKRHQIKEHKDSFSRQLESQKDTAKVQPQKKRKVEDRTPSPCRCPGCASRHKELKQLACCCTNCGQYFDSWAKFKQHQEKEHRVKEQN